jgi:hypothetical protein
VRQSTRGETPSCASRKPGQWSEAGQDEIVYHLAGGAYIRRQSVPGEVAWPGEAVPGHIVIKGRILIPEQFAVLVEHLLP